MKKILLILMLLLSCVWSEESSDSQWRGFFGVEGGAGIFGVGEAIIFSANPMFASSGYSFGVGYSGGIVGGLQKYTFDKVGIRYTLGLSFSYIPDMSSIRQGNPYDSCYFCKNPKKINLKNVEAQVYSGYYALDGLFDFVKNDDTHRFGMFLGLKVDVSGTIGGLSEVRGWVIQGGVHTGLYAQANNSIFELSFSVPIIGFGSGIVVYDSPITLGYKYLF